MNLRNIVELSEEELNELGQFVTDDTLHVAIHPQHGTYFLVQHKIMLDLNILSTARVYCAML